jgi:hypothetical protein
MTHSLTLTGRSNLQNQGNLNLDPILVRYRELELRYTLTVSLLESRIAELEKQLLLATQAGTRRARSPENNTTENVSEELTDGQG